MTPPDKVTNAFLLQKMEQDDEKHEEAHHRLRTDHRVLDAEVRSLKSEVEALKVLLAQHTLAMQDAKNATIDVGKLMFNPKMVMGIIGLVVSIVGGNYFTVQPLRTDLSVMQAKMDTQKDSVDDLKRQMEMRRLENQSLSNSVSQLQNAIQQLQRKP